MLPARVLRSLLCDWSTLQCRHNRAEAHSEPGRAVPQPSLLAGKLTWLLRVASSSKKPGRWTTTPFPMRHCAERFRMPDGMRCSLYLLPSGSYIVCPALAPPCAEGGV